MKDIARPDIKPAFAERNIPIALSTDENYLPYVKVVVNSILSCTKSGNIDILILHNGIPPQEIDLFLVDFAGVQNVSVRFVNIKKFVESTELSKFDQKRYLSAAACYRLLLPDVLDAYDKLIYLDVDTVVCHDLGELYATDLADNMFGAVIDVVNSSSKPDYAEWARGYGFVEWDEYVNTGVMLFNLARFRCASILDKLMPIAIEASKWFCDQDALNFVCKGQIVHLDPRWNVQVGDYCLKKQIAITRGEAFVYHFTGGKKPWSHPMHRYASLWWLNVREDGAALWRKSIGLGKSNGVRKNVGVSVIVPVYNAEPYLWECLTSVLSQTEQPGMEVICVDDGSTDRSLEILQTLLRLDTRVKLIRQTNQGPGVARNAGLEAAKGEYIFFLDADDRLASGDVLLRAYEQAKQDRLDMLLAASSTIAEDGRILKVNARLDSDIPQEPVFAPEALGAGLFLCTNMAPWGKLYRRAFLEESKLRFPPLKRSEDFPMVELALAVATRIGVLRQSISERRIGVTTSLESTKDETPLIFFEAEQLFRDSLRKRRLWAQFKMAVYSAFVTRLAYNLRAVRNYSSFRDIIAKYRQECRQWIRWDGVAMSECHSESLQLVKEIEKEMDENDQIALFVKLKEANAVAQTKATTLRQLDAAQKSRSKALEGFLKMRGERDEAREDRNRWKRDRDRVLAEKEKLLAQLNKQEQLIEVVRGEREKAKEDRNRWKRDRDRVLAEKEKLFAQLDKQEQLIEVVRGERENAKEDRNRWKKDRDRVLAEKEKLVAQLGKQERLIEVIRGERKKANEERARWKKDRDRVLAENEKLTASKKTCMKENKDLQNECRRLAAELDRNRKILEKLAALVGE